MTQEEVDLIYDHLHENYEYSEGNLIKRLKDKRSKTTRIIGSFVSTNKKPKIICSLNIKGKIYQKPLSHFIYLFFNKCFPEVIIFKDENPVNLKIENLRSVPNHLAKLNNYNKGYTEIKDSKNKINYKANMSHLGKNYSLGYYQEKNEAVIITNQAKKLFIMGLNDIEKIKEKIKSEYPWARFRMKKNRKCLPGVEKRGNKFRANIRVDGKNKYIGSYDTDKEAHEAYLKAKKELKNVQGND